MDILLFGMSAQRGDPQFDLFQFWTYTDAELAHVMAEFRKRNLYVLGYFKANLDSSPLGYDSSADHDEAIAKHYTTWTEDASGARSDTGMVDFTNPAAVAWWKARIVRALDKGLDGFMEDFGEQITGDMHFADGSTGEAMHNRYVVLYHRSTRKIFDVYEKAHPDRQLWFHNRSGVTGSAAYEGGNFPGDYSATWGRANGIAAGATDMLNRGVGGAYGFANQIGGYFDYHFDKTLGPQVPEELFIRWTEWAALSPVFLVHNSFIDGTSHSWSYPDGAAVPIFNRYAALHIRAATYIRRAWETAAETGVPIARPMWLAFPGDPTAATQDQEWMLGEDVLVAPVITQGATARELYLPAGCWTDANTSKNYNGPLTATFAAPLDVLPYFTRCGSDPFAEATSTPTNVLARPVDRATLPSTGGDGQLHVPFILLGAALARRGLRRRASRSRI